MRAMPTILNYGADESLSRQTQRYICWRVIQGYVSFLRKGYDTSIDSLQSMKGECEASSILNVAYTGHQRCIGPSNIEGC